MYMLWDVSSVLVSWFQLPFVVSWPTDTAVIQSHQCLGEGALFRQSAIINLKYTTHTEPKGRQTTLATNWWTQSSILDLFRGGGTKWSYRRRSLLLTGSSGIGQLAVPSTLSLTQQEHRLYKRAWCPSFFFFNLLLICIWTSIKYEPHTAFTACHYLHCQFLWVLKMP